MVTLTFDPRRIFPVGRQTAMREAVGWCHRLSWVVRRPVAWLVAVERGKAGLWHAHVLLVGAPNPLGTAPEAMWRQRNGFIRVTRVETAPGAVLYATKEAARLGDVELSDTLIRYRTRLPDRLCVALYAEDSRQQSQERAAIGSAGAPCRRDPERRRYHAMPTSRSRRAPFSRRGEQAIQGFNEAAVADSMPRTEVGDDVVYAATARVARRRARQCLQPAQPVAVCAGEAVTWENQEDECEAGDHARIIETLEHPNSITVGASGQRLSVALAADVLEPAVDAAASAQAANSLEKMLCHQVAAVHFAAMRLLAQSATPHLPPREVARLTNAAARLIDAYQSGCLTLQKLKTKGTQRVVVQHQQVHVGDGGQAVVAGQIEGGRGGEGRQNGQ